jgi:hypothetical protein
VEENFEKIDLLMVMVVVVDSDEDRHLLLTMEIL